MLLATTNKPNRLLFLSYVGHIRLEEIRHQRENMSALLADYPSGIRVLSDFTHLEKMDPDCTAELGLMMETVDKIGVELVVRVVPDAAKDLGLNILTTFHYRKRPRVVTCESFAEAMNALAF